MRITHFFLIGLIFAITACSGIRTKEILSAGGHIDSVRPQLGLPLQGIMDLPNGHKMWTFGSSSSGMMPMTSPTTSTIYSPYGTATAYGSQTSYMPMTFSCQVQIEAAQSGYILSWQYQGNNCP